MHANSFSAVLFHLPSFTEVLWLDVIGSVVQNLASAVCLWVEQLVCFLRYSQLEPKEKRGTIKAARGPGGEAARTELFS